LKIELESLCDNEFLLSDKRYFCLLKKMIVVGWAASFCCPPFLAKAYQVRDARNFLEQAGDSILL